LVIQHGKPLEDVLFFPSGGLFASAGGTDVKVWDMVGGGRQVQTKLTMAAPRESSTALEQDAPRLLTSSLDGHIQSFENY
jgi:U3 small nucleolar RNA-associated protein 15